MKTALQTLLKQPLLHFLAAGVLIFVAYAWQGNGDFTNEAGQQIRVDRKALLNFMQYRAQVFNRDSFCQRLDDMSADERQGLIEAFVREEVLYREALDLGLEEGDYDIRLRLVQKMNFLLQDIAIGQAGLEEVNEKDIRQFFEQYAEEYRIGSTYTFTHVFFDTEIHGDALARTLAEELLQELQNSAIDVDGAIARGNRFRYLRRYVDRGQTQITNNFGEDFVHDLDQLQVDPLAWAGPIASRLGWHVVRLEGRTDSRIPPLQEIEQRLIDDYRYAAQSNAMRDAEEALARKYDVVVEF
ncbi:MAG: peptidylprolyl isomerase [Gammaproteobacteria bacterium]|nr:peptidylprolyl isomerase [Gammaproteobacteria bacterium]